MLTIDDAALMVDTMLQMDELSTRLEKLAEENRLLSIENERMAVERFDAVVRAERLEVVLRSTERQLAAANDAIELWRGKAREQRVLAIERSVNPQ